MIRRAHQIAVSMFLEETGALGITNRQYGIMLVLRHQPGIDQITVAKLLGLDRSTTGMVLGKLEDAGLIGRVVGASDRRKRSLKLTPAGERMLARLAEPARRAQERVLSAFSPRERKMFLDLLEKFARAFNDTTRVPQVVQSTPPRHSGAPRSGEPGMHIIDRDYGFQARALSASGMTWRGLTRYGSCDSADTSPRSPRGWPTTRRRIFSHSRGIRGSRGRGRRGR